MIITPIGTSSLDKWQKDSDVATKAMPRLVEGVDKDSVHRLFEPRYVSSVVVVNDAKR